MVGGWMLVGPDGDHRLIFAFPFRIGRHSVASWCSDASHISHDFLRFFIYEIQRSQFLPVLVTCVVLLPPPPPPPPLPGGK